MERPEYYGILPAKVRYDERLKPMEKILFSELTVLVHKKGYCYANNSYFAKLYGVHKNTVSVWINNLAKYGHIATKCIMKDKQVEERRIYIVDESKKKSFQERVEIENEDKREEVKEEIKEEIIEEIVFNETFEELEFEEIEEEDEIEDFEKNLVEELFGKSKYQVEDNDTIISQEEDNQEDIIDSIEEEKEIVEDNENTIEEKIKEKREKTPEELEEIRRKLLKDLFGDKVVIELQKRKAEEELVEEEKQEIEVEMVPTNNNIDTPPQKDVIENKKMVGVSMENVGGYPLKNPKPINKKIEDNNTSRILQDYYYKKNKYIIYTHMCLENLLQENIFDVTRADKKLKRKRDKRSNETSVLSV